MTLNDLLQRVPYPDESTGESILYVKGLPVWDYKIIEDKGISLIASSIASETGDPDFVSLEELLEFRESQYTKQEVIFEEETGEELKNFTVKEGIINLY